MMRKTGIIIVLLMLLPFTPGRAQTGVSMNGANFQDPRVLLVNPAAMTFLDRGLFVSGYRLHYISLSGEHLGSFYSGLSYPFSKAGVIGITVQWFRSDIFQTIQGDLNYSTPLRFLNNKIALSGRVGLVGISYDSPKFNLIEANDPLLRSGASTNKISLGVGIAANPLAGLYLAFSANHLNRPDLSLVGGQTGLPISTNISAFYLHPIFRPQISLEREANETYLNVGLESWLLDNRAMLSGNVHSERLSFGAAYRFSNWRIDLEYDYALSDLSEVSDGSFQLTLSYQFAKIPPIEFGITMIPLDSTLYLEKGVLPGQNAQYRITIQAVGSFSNPVDLNDADMPANLSLDLIPSRISPATAGILHVTVDPACTPGDYPIRVKGTAGDVTRFGSSILRVRRPIMAAKISSSIDTVTVTEIRRIAEESPLLNYVFFEDSSDQIPVDRYVLLDATRDSLPNLAHFTRLSGIAEQYSQMLNLFGRRLLDNPKLEIILVGCNADAGSEQGDQALSQRRAQRVKGYLVNVWGISEKRISVQSRDLPERFSPKDDSLGQQENRRVEIHAAEGSEEILAAFSTTTVETEFSPPNCLLQFTDVVADAGVKSWQLAIKESGGQILRTITSDSTLPDSETWDWRENGGSLILTRDSLLCTLTIQDGFDKQHDFSGPSIQVRYVELESEAEPTVTRSRLIFFSFDDDRLDLQHPRLQAELEKIAMKFRQYEDASLQVNGFTDTTGESTYNVMLSKRRAKAVKEELIQRGIPAYRISTDGFGPKNPLMSNQFPEGRMMNRRVEVEIVVSPATLKH